MSSGLLRARVIFVVCVALPARQLCLRHLHCHAHARCACDETTPSVHPNNRHGSSILSVTFYVFTRRCSFQSRSTMPTVKREHGQRGAAWKLWELCGISSPLGAFRLARSWR